MHLGIEFSPELRERELQSCLGCFGRRQKPPRMTASHSSLRAKASRAFLPSPFRARDEQLPGPAASPLEYGITGPVFTISTACSSANHAIGQAFRMVRSAVQVDVAIAGGSEAPLSMGFLKA